MDAFMKKIERLADMAKASSAPLPLDRSGILARIRGLEREDDTVLSMPFGFFAGGAAAAAVAALVVAFFAVSAWNDLNSPIEAIDQMFNMMDVL
jgi:hypothetical protein